MMNLDKLRVAKLIVHLKERIIWLFQDVTNLIRRDTIFVCGFFARSRYGYLHNNWGDDINIYFFESITDRRVRVINNSHLYRLLVPTNYSCIGSIIGFFTNNKTIVWGSGLISEDASIPFPPKKICSVRGPLTRNILLQKGIQCPEKYGDPALLVSKFYQPKVTVKYKLGIVPHVVDYNNDILHLFAESHPDVLIISMSDYTNWHDIPDQICSCEKIISSSLHGLIVSDSYSIPNQWVHFSDRIVGGSFKYRDYFASVGRCETEPIVINSLVALENLYYSTNFAKAENIDYMSILKECPFKEYIKEYKYHAEDINSSTSI